MANRKNKSFFILDVFPLVYRAHFAMAGQRLRNSKGLDTSAILGFYNYLFQILFKERPAYLAAAFDSFSLHRGTVLKSYKENRDLLPEDVLAALPYVRSLLKSLHIKCFEEHGFEADDVIGSIAVKAAEKGLEVFIVSPDKDFAQLVSPNISLYRPPYKGTNFEVLNREGVIQKYGVPPEQIADFLALSGDAADNIPGLPKIGPKTAQKLLLKYGSLENILKNKDEQKGVVLAALSTHESEALLYKQVATIDASVAPGINEKDLLAVKPDVEKLLSLLEELEFVKLKERIANDRVYGRYIREAEQSNPDNYHPKFALTELAIGAEFSGLMAKALKAGRLYFSIYCTRSRLHFFFCGGRALYYISFLPANIPPALARLVESPQMEMVSHGIKNAVKEFIKSGAQIRAKLFDVQLAEYVLDPERNNSFNNLIKTYTGKGIDPELPMAPGWAGLTKFLKKLYQQQCKKIEKGKEKKLLYQIEFPLVPVLAKMELAGVRFDQEVLGSFSEKLRDELDGLEKRIFSLTGENINLNSPRQVSVLLSKIIDPKTARKTKTGQLSTSEEILAGIAEYNEIGALLLRVRQVNKLLSTYTDALPRHIQKDTGRVHPDFKQATTATGRLSCMEPNLQNLPVKTEEAREVRKALVPENDNFLIMAADYSQIELRILAFLSGDPALGEAFRKKQDVHDIAAERIFHVPKSKITKELRAKAKMVNYGIAYGLSAFGLSRNLKISLEEAKEIIENYFEEFENIRDFVDKSIELAEENTYSETMLGRRRYIPGINSRNRTIKKMAERIAINAPIQGLAADIIKIAMVEIDREMQEGNFKSRLILQVHDELVFEVYKPELKNMLKLVRRIMEKPVGIRVPLEVNIGVGKNWMELEKVGEKLGVF